MPRTRPLGDQWPEKFRAEVKYHMELCHIKNYTELARRMNIPQSTLSRHLKDPAIMSVNELRLMAKTLGMSTEDVGRLITKGGFNK